MDNKLTHFDNSGNARMVDVGSKVPTERVAIAVSRIKVSEETLELIEKGQIGKGDVLGVARVAGIMASKQTSNLIPMCHPLMISSCNIDFDIFQLFHLTYLQYFHYLILYYLRVLEPQYYNLIHFGKKDFPF